MTISAHLGVHAFRNVKLSKENTFGLTLNVETWAVNRQRLSGAIILKKTSVFC